jgi:phosphate transport system substrate-binding protein
MARAHRTRVTTAAGILTATVLAIVTVIATGCGGSSDANSSSGSATTPLPPLTSGTIVGAGATFPQPLYSKWGEDYASVSDVKLNYQGIGSGGGIQAIEAETVDFGASDAPLPQADLEANGLVQFPMVIGGVVMVVNLEGVRPGGITLDAETLAGIFNGDITVWNDPAIAKLNAGVSLPSTAINVVHRSDSSGTTWIFTNYLTAAAGDTWKAGADKEVTWPTGVGAKGSSGVAATVQQVAGSIGYVDQAYAFQNDMTYTKLVNGDGKVVGPSLVTIGSAALHADWKKAAGEGFYVLMVNTPGAESWPITGASFILMRKDAQDAARAKATLDFFDWAYTQGDQSAGDLTYVPIPKLVYSMVEKSAWTQITAGGQSVWTK